MTSHVLVVVAVFAVIGLGMGAYAWSGNYNIGADDPHWGLTRSLMQTVRDRSIHARSMNIVVPALDDPQVILKGAGQYAAMCTGCHLKPGMRDSDSEMRPGLYPQPPNLSQVRVDPQEAFWVIKHGIKMSAMPAWGFSHDDATIWSMVAFLRKLPDLTPEQYKGLVAKAPADDDMDMGKDARPHRHDSDVQESGAGAGAVQGHEHGHSHGDAPGLDEHQRVDAVSTADRGMSMDGLEPNAVPDAEAVALAFHAALQTGDRQSVVTLLAPEVTVTEGGETQSRDEYVSHHLGEDIAFLKDAKITPISLRSILEDDTAVVGSEADIGMMKQGRLATTRTRELLKLKRQGTTWKIVSIKWQSELLGKPPRE